MPTITKAEAERMGLPTRTLQTVEIPIKFSLKFSRDFLREKDLHWRNMSRTINYRRFRQTPPIEEAEYHSKKIPNGMIFVYQTY